MDAEVSALLMQRNTVAAALSRLHELPPMLQDPKTCSYCSSLSTCALLHKVHHPCMGCFAMHRSQTAAVQDLACPGSEPAAHSCSTHILQGQHALTHACRAMPTARSVLLSKCEADLRLAQLAA